LKQLSPIYHCSQCKRITYSIEELLFVEDGSIRGFCQESCINNYFSSHIAWFEEREDAIRHECVVSRSDDTHSFDLLSDPKYVDSTLKAPDEIWKIDNHLKEEIFIFISHFGSLKSERSSVIVLCTIFNFIPSFVFLVTMTGSEKVLTAFRSGEEVVDKGPFLQSMHNLGESAEIGEGGGDRDWEQIIAAKKSSLLASLLSVRSDADIPIESFHLYNSYLDTTIKQADEVYRSKDQDGDDLFTYVKSYHEGGVSFYYIVVCLCSTQKEVEEVSIIPIISFPTIDSATYEHYIDGERLHGTTKN
jgi:hypothetical protein